MAPKIGFGTGHQDIGQKLLLALFFFGFEIPKLSLKEIKNIH